MWILPSHNSKVWPHPIPKIALYYPSFKIPKPGIWIKPESKQNEIMTITMTVILRLLSSRDKIQSTSTNHSADRQLVSALKTENHTRRAGVNAPLTDGNRYCAPESSGRHCYYNLSFPAVMEERPSWIFVVSIAMLPRMILAVLIQLISVFIHGNTTSRWDSPQSSHSELLLTFSLGHHRESRTLKQLICLLKPQSADWYLDWLSREPITWIKRSALSKQCKQAITNEPFLPCKDQVQIQVNSLSHLQSTSCWLSIGLKCTSAPQAAPIMTRGDLSNGQGHWRMDMAISSPSWLRK